MLGPAGVWPARDYCASVGSSAGGAHGVLLRVRGVGVNHVNRGRARGSQCFPSLREGKAVSYRGPRLPDGFVVRKVAEIRFALGPRRRTPVERAGQRSL